MKNKYYDVYKSGSTKLKTIQASCITKAIKKFTETLEKPVKYELYNRDCASVAYIDNYTIMSDFVIQLSQ